MFKRLNRCISTSASLGGMLIGSMTLLADLTGSIGSGSAILVAASTLIFYQDELKTHRFLFYNDKVCTADVLKDLFNSFVLLMFGGISDQPGPSTLQALSRRKQS